MACRHKRDRSTHLIHHSAARVTRRIMTAYAYRHGTWWWWCTLEDLAIVIVLSSWQSFTQGTFFVFFVSPVGDHEFTFEITHHALLHNTNHWGDTNVYAVTGRTHMRYHMSGHSFVFVTSVLKSRTRKGNTIRVIEARRKLTRRMLVPVWEIQEKYIS